MNDTIVIERRFRGPPDSANGGYACGVVAGRMGRDAKVRLHRPPPLDRRLVLRVADAERALLADGDVVVAEGRAVQLDAPPLPAAVPFAVAAAASERYRWFDVHPFPGCFVCGPDRRAGDGLRIFPGAVPGSTTVAAAWVPDVSVCDASGHVRPEVVWAALDCPSWFGILEFEVDAGHALLGELGARISRTPAEGEKCVVVGWSRGRDGRKLYGGACVYGEDGTVAGWSESVWIEMRPETHTHTRRSS